MKLTSATFKFIKGHVSWRLADNSAPVCEREGSSYGKKYKWIITLTVTALSTRDISWYSFISPSATHARRLLQNEIKEVKQKAKV